MSVVKQRVCRLRSVKRIVASRAYFNLRDPADVPLLAAALDGRAFVTERGSQHRCSVEYAPCQRVPPLRVKRDPREGTIEAGAHSALKKMDLRRKALQIHSGHW